ncbi:sensor histidine kinase [Streptomyces smyrnaeus]|uniref:sensor histidine kinase n=1 Tax=Streptomyces smyrnaeus TaxID=1387713 RepID=UPI0033D0FD68
MSASAPLPPPLPLLKRVPPGVWTALVWVAAAVQPIVEYVLMPQRHEYSLSYPRDGLAPLTARVLLALAFLAVLAGSALLRRRTAVAYGLLIVGTVVASVAWRQDEVVPLQFLGVDVALCYVAATRPRRTAIIAAAGALGVLAGYLVLRRLTGEEAGTASEPFVALTVVIAWLIGNSLHQVRAHTAELHARTAAQAVTAERLRIAREMHDTVAHSIGIIALQAGAAARVVETQPAKAREAMLTVEHTGRDTLAGLRRLLGALRQADQEQEPGPRDQEPTDCHDQGHSRAPLRPAAGLADLERLAATTTAAGVRVEVRWQGERRPLPADTDLAAFRIVQEAVTNVVRHAGAEGCQVTVEYREDELGIEVVDRGRGGSTHTKTPQTGFGLAGIRERVALLHGRFTAGPRPGGGFKVAARLPVPTAEAAGTGLVAKAGAG